METRAFYLTIDSKGADWAPETGTIILRLKSPIYLANFQENQWHVSLIDYRVPINETTDFMYLHANFIENQRINGNLACILAIIHPNAKAGDIQHPVPCLVTENPLSVMTLQLFDSSHQSLLKFLDHHVVFMLKFQTEASL